MYKYVIPMKCVLDAEKAGNWIRFINSPCEPNLYCRPAVIGKRAVVLFQAKSDIGPEEELTFSYAQATSGTQDSLASVRHAKEPRKERNCAASLLLCR